MAGNRTVRPNASQRKCKFCAAFQPGETSKGECRRRAPTGRPDWTTWPEVEANDWCFEFALGFLNERTEA